MGAIVPIDLDALKVAPRPLQGMTDRERNWSEVRRQMDGSDIATQTEAHRRR